MDVGAIVSIITQMSKLELKETYLMSHKGTKPGLPDNRAHSVIKKK